MCVLIAFLFLSSIVGVYAVWTYYHPFSPLSLEMEMKMSHFSYDPEEILYISNVEIVSTNVDSLEFDYSLPTDISSSVSNTLSNSTVVYKVTVHNNTDVTYWYFGTDINPAYGSNSLIGADQGISIVTKDKLGDSFVSFNTGDWVPPRTMRDFYVIYTYGPAAMGDFSTLVTYHFGIRMDAVYDGFLAILNDKVSENGYYYLAEVFNQKYAQDRTTVIGNIGEDKAVFDRLFGEDLTIEVDGVVTPVTVMVQRENVDSRTTGDSYSGGAPSGCEYTVYITVDPMNSPTGEAIVYAISYSCKNTGENAGTWYQIGQLYEGTADYTNGVIDVDSWIATPNTYTISNGISYKVGQTQHGTNYDMLKTVEEIMSTDDNEIYNKIDNSGILKKVYDALKSNQNSSSPEVLNLRIAFEELAPYYNNYNNGQQFQMKRESTRAEILPYIISLCNAYDYYTQVHE